MKLDEKFFENLEKSFENSKSDFRISFTEEKLIDRDDDFSFEEERQEAVLKVDQILKQHKIKLNWMKCSLEIQNRSIVTELIEFTSHCLSFFNNKLTSLQQNLNLQKKNTITVTKSFNNAVKKFENTKIEILEKCTLLLNSKKAKIRDLEDKISGMIMKQGRFATQNHATGKDLSSNITTRVPEYC